MRDGHLDSNVSRRPLLRRRPARWLVALIALGALAGCGGGDSSPQLVDGSQAAELPAELDGLDNAVLTRTSIHTGQLDKRRFTACGQPPVPSHTVIVERTGIHGSSWTFADEPALYGCDAILDPSTAAEPDRPYDGIWCGSANGRIENGMLNDPRLDLCTNTDSEITAFAWVDPRPDGKWVVVSDTGKREVYEVVESLPVRVTTTENIDPAGKASFDVEEYGADGALLTEYTLEAAVAG